MTISEFPSLFSHKIAQITLVTRPVLVITVIFGQVVAVDGGVLFPGCRFHAVGIVFGQGLIRGHSLADHGCDIVRVRRQDQCVVGAS